MNKPLNSKEVCLVLYPTAQNFLLLNYMFEYRELNMIQGFEDIKDPYINNVRETCYTIENRICMFFEILRFN